VVDGYNTDEFFHVNFGWGGQYNGWYLLPSEMPYNLTVLEGAIVDIQPYRFAEAIPESIDIMTPDDLSVPHEITLWNVNMLGDITVEAYIFDESFAGATWTVTGLDLPVTFSVAESITFTLQAWNLQMLRDTLETNFRIIHNNGVVNVPIRLNRDLVYNTDYTLPINAGIVLRQNYPNPFNSATTLDFALIKNSEVTLSVYNLKGERVRNLTKGNYQKGNHSITWDGKDANGKHCPSGMYLFKLKSGVSESVKRIVLIK